MTLNPDAIFGAILSIASLVVIARQFTRFNRSGSIPRYEGGTLLIACSWLLMGLVWFFVPTAGMDTWKYVLALSGVIMLAGFALCAWGYGEHKSSEVARRLAGKL